jgi:hypothetical protein
MTPKLQKTFHLLGEGGVNRVVLFLQDCGRLIVTYFNPFGFGRQKKIRAFFEGAVRVYALRGEEDAKCAAMAAAKMAGRKQRQSMIEQLSKMASNVLQHYPDKLARKSVADRILLLKEDVASQGWLPGDFKEEEDKLLKKNAEYLACLKRADPSVFARKHPDLF